MIPMYVSEVAGNDTLRRVLRRMNIHVPNAVIRHPTANHTRHCIANIVSHSTPVCDAVTCNTADFISSWAQVSAAMNAIHNDIARTNASPRNVW
jgi:hypothetical protein